MNIHMDYLASLACNRQVLQGLLFKFIHVINNNNNLCYCLMLSNDLLRIVQDFSEYSTTRDNSLQYLTCVCFVEKNASQQVPFGSGHITFALVDLQTKQVTYFDSLGWKTPLSFISKLKSVLLGIVGHDDVDYNIRYAHVPSLQQDQRRYEAHKCTNDCYKHYPLQTCHTICAVPVMIGLAMVFEDFDRLSSLCRSDKECNVLYLRNISYYGSFVRLIIYKWLSEGQVHISDICVDESEHNDSIRVDSVIQNEIPATADFTSSISTRTYNSQPIKNTKKITQTSKRETLKMKY